MHSRLTLRDFALGLALLLIAGFFAYASPQFLSARNLSLLLIELSVTATLALGMLLVILPGHIDLSAGSGVGLIGGIAAVLVSGGDLGVRACTGLRDLFASAFGAQAGAWVPIPPWTAASSMLFAVVIALVIWWLMGTLIVRERIPSFIVSLGGLLVFRGLFWLLIEYKTVPVVEAVQGPPGTSSTWLHLGDWRYRVWELVREESGAFDLSLAVDRFHFPVLRGSGNLYSALTTSYFSVPAGYTLAGLVVFLLVVAAWRGRRQRRAYGLETTDGELSFLRLFIASQLILLTVIVSNLYRGIPLPAVVLAVVAFFVWLITHHTPFGRYLYAIGGNEEAALVSGIAVKRVTIGAFTLMGFIVALTGFMQTGYGGYSTTTVGDLMELDAVAACVIGGVSLRGGRGTVLGVLFGALIMALLINGMTLLEVEPARKFIARGAVLILAVWMDVRLNKA